MRRKATSTPESKAASMERALEWLGDEVHFFPGPSAPGPLDTPAHRRHLREAARVELRSWEERWLRMGADPESMAEACEGARVRLMSEARARGTQG